MQQVVFAAAIAGLMGLGAQARAQAPDADVLRVDVLAVDRDGRPVADLGADDFEVRDRGKVQKVLRARFVAPADEPRTIVFVVDDLGLSFRSAALVREALERFVDDQMRADDRVAIVRTYSTYSDTDTTQITTTDKKALHEKAARLRYNPMQRGPRTSAFDVRHDSLVHATLECVHAVVRDLGAVPGRKTVVLLSDGIDGQLGRVGFIDAAVRGALDDVVDAANRGSVVVYAVDAGGLGSAFTRSTWRREAEHYPLFTLAQETGGLFLWSTDVEVGLARILAGESGHYVVEYRAEPAAGKAEARSIGVKVRKPGVKTRARTAVFAAAPKPGA